MNSSLITSMVSMSALQQKLDIMADNMANLNTTGYKRKQASFEDIINNLKQQPEHFERQGRLSPLGYSQSWGARLAQVQYDLSQGALKESGVSTDLAIEGKAFFQVDANGQVAYTRDGSFQLAAVKGDADHLYLANSDGHLVQGVNGPIAIPKGQSMTIAPDGTVTAFSVNAPQEAVAVGRIKLVVATKPQFLQQIGNNLFIVPQEMNNAQDQVVRDAVFPADYNADDPNRTLSEPIAIRQGWLEQSNVDLADQMTETLMVQRAYQLSARAVSSSDTMMNLANNLRG
ncbi:MAG: flagellar hook-basal body protein [Gorillibacterium sp.]|nr:flagellar hook-basal body protein [Gorillibacterium sp.]